MTIRRGNGRTAKGRPVVLTERDILAFLLIGKCRYVTIGQIARALDWSEDRCRRRIALLSTANYLRPTAAGSRMARLIALGSLGLAVLREHHPDAAERIRLPGLIRLGGVPHHLAVVDVRLYLSDLCRAPAPDHRKMQRCATLPGAEQSSRTTRTFYDARESVALLAFRTAGEVANDAPFKELQLAPDAIAIVGMPGSDRGLRCAIEVDVGANESVKTIERKLERHRAAVGRGAVDELWFVVVAGQRRRAQIGRLVEAAGLSAITRVIPHEHTVQRPVEAPPVVVAATTNAPTEAEQASKIPANPPSRSREASRDPKYGADEEPRSW